MPLVVLLDTNIWVSALLNPRGMPARAVRAWLDNRFEVVISLPLLRELSDVLTRPRIINRYALNAVELGHLIETLIAHARVVTPTGSLRVCRDPDDDLVLETALLGNARYVVTRDDDLKRDPDLIRHLETHGVSVVSVRDFLSLLETETP